MSNESFRAQQMHNDAHPFQRGRKDPLLYTMGMWTIGVCYGLLMLSIVAQMILLVYSVCR